MKEINKIIHEILCPPGMGVFTVNTAKERKESLHQLMYGRTSEIEETWKDSLLKLESEDRTSDVNLLGVCSDTGGGILRGANWGPLFLRESLLKDDASYFDLGDIRVIPHLLHDKYLNEQTIKSCRKALYQNENSAHPVSPLSITEYFLDLFYEKFPKKKVFAIGGDHSVSYPLVKSYLKAKKKQDKRVAIIHFDAHTDLLVERLGIDLCFGSWCTHILDGLESDKHLLQFGIRSSGKDRSHWEETFGVQQFWTKEIKEKGPETIAIQVREYLLSEGIEELYVSFDIDALDEKYASATGTPESGGLSPDDAMIILRTLGSALPITGADMVEIAPFVTTNKLYPEPETTLLSATPISHFLIEAMKKAHS